MAFCTICKKDLEDNCFSRVSNRTIMKGPNKGKITGMCRPCQRNKDKIYNARDKSFLTKYCIGCCKEVTKYDFCLRYRYKENTLCHTCISKKQRPKKVKEQKPKVIPKSRKKKHGPVNKPAPYRITIKHGRIFSLYTLENYRKYEMINIDHETGLCTLEDIK